MPITTRSGVMHRALVRQIIAAEGQRAFDLRAKESLEKLSVLLQYVPLTPWARECAQEWLEEARASIEGHL
jgi:hypothetical protein